MVVESASWPRYAAWYVLSLLMFCLLVGGFNAVIDPYARLLLIEQAGFNKIKVTLPRDSRKGKAKSLRQCNFDTVILGTSRAESGIMTSQPALAGVEAYNAALKAASMYEMRRLVEYALQHQNPDTVILGLDFVSFSTNLMTADDFEDSPLAETVPLASLAKYLVSLQTLRESWFTLNWNQQGKGGKCADRGEHKSKRVPDEARKTFDFILKRYASGQYQKYVAGPEHIEHLVATLRLLAASNVKVYAFISPMHVTQIELLTEMGLLDEYTDWKRQLVQAFAAADADFGKQRQPELWDFSGYSEYTTEKIPSSPDNPYMQWYMDPAHFRKELGNLVIYRMYGAEPESGVAIGADFGVLLTPANIDDVIAADREGSARYRKENAAEIARMQEMLRFAPYDMYRF